MMNPPRGAAPGFPGAIRVYMSLPDEVGQGGPADADHFCGLLLPAAGQDHGTGGAGAVLPDAGQGGPAPGVGDGAGVVAEADGLVAAEVGAVVPALAVLVPPHPRGPEDVDELACPQRGVHHGGQVNLA